MPNCRIAARRGLKVSAESGFVRKKKGGGRMLNFRGVQLLPFREVVLFKGQK